MSDLLLPESRKARVNVAKIAWFLGLTFAINWTMAIVYFACGGTLHSIMALPLLTGYMFVPAIVAIIVQKGIFHEPVIKPLGLSFKLNRWFLIAWWMPLCIAVITVATSALTPGMHISLQQAILPPAALAHMPAKTAALFAHPWVIILLSLLAGLTAGLTINAFFALGEELGWRGLLLRELLPLGYWPAALLIGIIWGLWHAPIIIHGFNYPQHPKLGIAMMVLMTLGLTPLIMYFRLRAGSVIAAAIFHGTFNGVVGVPLLLTAGGNDLLAGVTGLAGILALLILNILLFWYDRFHTKIPLTTPTAQVSAYFSAEERQS